MFKFFNNTGNIHLSVVLIIAKPARIKEAIYAAVITDGNIVYSQAIWHISQLRDFRKTHRIVDLREHA